MPTAEDCIICPGVFDGISAHIANAAGFDALYLAGSGASGSVIGEPDLSVISGTELADTARMIVGISDAPVIADADTGCVITSALGRFPDPAGSAMAVCRQS